jgi:hypothetical protein
MNELSSMLKHKTSEYNILLITINSQNSLPSLKGTEQSSISLFYYSCYSNASSSILLTLVSLLASSSSLLLLFVFVSVPYFPSIYITIKTEANEIIQTITLAHTAVSESYY